MLSMANQKMELSFKSICKECQNSYIEALQHNIEEEAPIEKIKLTETKTVCCCIYLHHSLIIIT